MVHYAGTVDDEEDELVRYCGLVVYETTTVEVNGDADADADVVVEIANVIMLVENVDYWLKSLKIELK